MHTSSRGFTLVELLVVIGIVAALIAILMPALSRARQQAVAVQCGNQVREVMRGWLMYASEHKGLLPAAANGDPYPGRYPNMVYYYVQEESPDIEFEHGVILPYLGRTPESRSRLFLCPAATTTSPNVSYVFSADLLAEKGPRKITQIRRSAERIPLAEQEVPDDDGNFDPDDDDDTGCVRHFRRSLADGSVTGKGNYGFADGHVEMLTPADLRAHPEWVRLFGG